MSRPLMAALARTLAGAALLALTLWQVGARSVAVQLLHLDLRWLALGVLLAAPQLALLAFRWCLTAHALGLPLRYGKAVREYALSMLVNQLLPLGVMGDVARVTRHGLALGAQSDRGADARSRYEPALRAVLVERASGQLPGLLAATAALPLWAAALQARSPAHALHVGMLGGLVSGALGLTLAWPRARAWLPLAALRRLWRDARTALLTPARLGPQLLLSSAVASTVVGQLFCVLRGLGLALSFTQALQVMPFMLLSMTLPASIAGFGAREAVTATAYRALGLSSEHGAALAMGYGVLCLLCGVLGFVASRVIHR